VAGALGTALDDDVTIWYEPLFDPSGTRPDLVVLDPRHGVLVLEVLKGKGSSHLLGAINGELRIDIDGKEVGIPSPLDRAELYVAALRESMAAHPELASVPVGALAVFTGLTRDAAESKSAGDVVDMTRCIFKSDLDTAIADAEPAPLLRAFVRATRGSLHGVLTAETLTLMRAVIHPDAIVHPRPAQGSLFSAAAVDGDVIKVMDRKQEKAARSIGSGHRVIRGVAGSGKTLVLVHRARLLSQMLPNRRVLVTCFTRSLASQLRTHLGDCANVEVLHLDKLMYDAIVGAGMKYPGFGDGAASVPKTALEALDKKDAPKFRAVLIDEAQDFDTEALQFCIRLLESTDPNEQDLIIVADSAQNIFRKNFHWKDAGVKAQGRTQLLRTNYRNTRQILAFAYGFLTADAAIGLQAELDPDDDTAIIPAEASERSGNEPRVVPASDVADEVAKVVESVRDYYADRSPARSIAVLYGERAEGATAFAASLADGLGAAGLPYFWVTDPDNKDNRDLAGETDSPVVLSTVYSAKGLEFPSVVLCGLGARKESDHITARKLIYVGMTRAINDLTVVVATESPFKADFE
jgi:superfamily I DNA and RNA helicase